MEKEEYLDLWKICTEFYLYSKIMNLEKWMFDGRGVIYRNSKKMSEQSDDSNDVVCCENDDFDKDNSNTDNSDGTNYVWTLNSL